MATLSRKEYRVGRRICLFEIGYRSPDDGCHYVLNPDSDRLERVFTIESGFIEGKPFARVETSRDCWYEVDGSTVFAKNLGEIGGSSEVDDPDSPEEELVAAMALA
jgi:hypothetical protein